VVLVLTAHESEELMLKELKPGAARYVLKGSHPARLVRSVREALQGESPIDQRMAGRLLRRLADEQANLDEPPRQVGAEEGAKYPLLPSLSARELEVLRYVVAGKANRLIAQELHISLSTVKRHLERINSKLGVSDRTQAAVKAIEMGLLPQAAETKNLIDPWREPY